MYGAIPWFKTFNFCLVEVTFYRRLSGAIDLNTFVPLQNDTVSTNPDALDPT